MNCKLGILNAKCRKEKEKCKFYQGELSKETCQLYAMLNSKYMSDRDVSVFNIWLGGVLKKD